MMVNCEQDSVLNFLPAPKILPNKKGVRAKGDKRRYIQVLSSFDIETTRITTIDNSVMYIWQWSFYDLETNEFIRTIYGRTWGEYVGTCLEIKQWISQVQSEEPVFMVRLVHNLSYEFQFISAFVEYPPESVFAIKKRKIARADSYNCIEDRCTYIHSNMSLDKYAETWNAEHQKLSGIEFDYSKPRWAWTELTEKELAYCEHDVLSVIEAYVNEMRHFNDTLYTVPLQRLVM